MTTGVKPIAVRHATKSSQKDGNTILEALHKKYKAFEAKGMHSRFPAFLHNHMLKINQTLFRNWVQDHISKLTRVQNKKLKLHVGPPQREPYLLHFLVLEQADTSENLEC